MLALLGDLPLPFLLARARGRHQLLSPGPSLRSPLSIVKGQGVNTASPSLTLPFGKGHFTTCPSLTLFFGNN